MKPHLSPLGIVACNGLAAALLVGCAPVNLDATYGQRRGAEGGLSVNGTAVLADLFSQAGHRVQVWWRLSPKLQPADVIVWAPDDFQPPTPEQRAYLENWLSEQAGRTLVYIGRDYDAATSYWEQMQLDAPAGQALEIARRLATAQAQHAARKAAVPRNESCDWFRLRAGSRRKVNSLQGPWAAGVDAEESDIEIATRLEPPNPEDLRLWAARQEYAWRAVPQQQPLLSSGKDVLVHQIRLGSGETNQILIVANGSFLLNLPLVNRQHRLLAAQLVEACGPPGRVMFLESGPGGPEVLDREAQVSYPTGLEMFAVWPLGVITLHLAALGLVVCFALFPQLGRLHDPESGTRADFSQHIDALAELIEQTGDRGFAQRCLEDYHRQNSAWSPP